MKVTSIKTAQQLIDAHTKDRKTAKKGFLNGVGLVNYHACTKTLVIERDGKTIASNKWFITYEENELIYDIKGNNWVNLNMFENGESYCKEILLIGVEE